VAELAPIIGVELSVSFAEHESSYLGDPYYVADDERFGELRLTENLDPMHDPVRDPPEEHLLPGHSDFSVILWVEDEKGAAEAARLIRDVVSQCEVVPDR